MPSLSHAVRRTIDDLLEEAQVRFEDAARRVIGNPGEVLYIVAMSARLQERDDLMARKHKHDGVRGPYKPRADRPPST